MTRTLPDCPWEPISSPSTHAVPILPACRAETQERPNAMVSRTDRPSPLPSVPPSSPTGHSAAGFDADVIVAGAGAVGLTLAIALAQAGLNVIVAGRITTR